MTDSTNQPAGKGPEVTPDATALNDALHAQLQLGAHPGHVASTPADKPGAATAAAPQAEDHRSVLQAGLDGGSGGLKQMFVGTALAFGGSGGPNDQQMADRLKHNAAVHDAPDVGAGALNLVKGLGSMLRHPLDTASSAWNAGAKTVDTMAHGTANQKAELVGGGLVLAGTLLLPVAGKLGRIGTEADAVGVAGSGLTKATEAKAAVTVYREGANAAFDTALARSEQRAATTAAEKALTAAAKPAVTLEKVLAAKPAVALEVSTPATTTVDVGARLHLPTLEPVTPPASLASRIKSTITAPFKSALGTSEGVVGESGTSPFRLLKEDKPLGTLPTQFKVDGLRTGDVTVPGVHPGERFAVAEREPIKLPAGPGAAPVEPIKVKAPVVEPPVEPLKAKAPVVEPPVEPVKAKAPVVEPHGEPVKVKAAVVESPVEPVKAKAAVGESVNVGRPVAESTPEGGAIAKSTVHPADGKAPLQEGSLPARTDVVDAPSLTDKVTGKVTGHVSGKELPHTTSVAPPVEAKPVLSEEVGSTAKLQLEKPGTGAVLPTAGEAPATIANRAGNNLESFSRLTSEKGVVLSPDAQMGLQELSTQIKAVSEGTSEALTVASRNQMAENIAKVERSLTASGADASVTQKFSELKAAIKPLAEGTIEPVAAVEPVVAAPVAASTQGSAAVAAAGKAGDQLENFSRLTSEKGVVLSPDAQRGLQELSTQIRAVSEGTSEALTVASRNQMAENIAKVEQSLTASGADASVTQKFSELKAAIKPLAEGAIEPVAAVEPVVAAPVAASTQGSTAAAAAGKAGNNLESFSRLTSEKGVVLSPDAQRGLQELSTQIKAVSEGTSEALTVASRNQMAENIAKVEQSLTASGADATVARQFSDLKASINELAPSAVGPIAPVTEAPVVLAGKAGQSLETFTRAAGEKGLTLSPEAERSLANVNAQIKSLAEANAAPLTSQASAQMSQDLAVVERSLTTSGADASVVKQFGQVKASISDLSAAAGEREQLTVLRNSMSTLEAQGAELSTSVKGLSRQLEDRSAMSAADRKVAGAISDRLDTIDQKIARGALTETPLAASSDIQQVVRDLDKPEYSSFFANNPEAAKAFEGVKASTAEVAATTSKVESAQIGIGGIRQAEAFQQNVDRLAILSRDLQAAMPAAEASEPVATALKNIQGDLATIKGGANSEAVLRRVQANIEAIDGAGAGDIAAQLKQGMGDLESTSTALDRTRRLEASITTIQGEGATLESQSAKLSQEFNREALTAPSTTAVVPANAQVADQLQLISRQAKLLDASEAGTAAATKIKDAFTRVEELTAQSTLTADQSAILQDMRASIAKIDQASVEATGLRRLENSAVQIARQSSRVEDLTATIAKANDLTTPAALDAQAEQRLGNIARAAQDVKTATTLDDQIVAVNKLAKSVQDADLQAFLARNKAGARSLEELQASTAELHESVSYRALERSKAIAAAEADNSVTAARALETRIQNDIALANAPAVQAAATDYRTAAEAFADAPDKTLAATQMEQKLETLQVQLNTAARNSAVLQSQEMAALYRSQTALSQSVADSELMSRYLINKRLPVVESGFEQIGKATSSAVQQQYMRDLSGQIQNLRYLEGSTGPGADQLSLAQMQLARAQNDLEVAAYRSSLVKLAAAGDKTATDKLLISGLTSDGFKANGMVASSGPAARLVEDFARSRTNLQGLMDQPSYSVRSLAASDPIFANNPNLLARAVRGTSYTLIGVGAPTLVTGIVGRQFEKSGSGDKAASAGAIQPLGQGSAPSGQPAGPAAQADQKAAARGSAPDAVTTAGAATNNASGVAAPEGRVIGRSAGEPNGFSANGQAVVRSAFSQDLANQAIPRSSSAIGTGAGSDTLQPSLTLAQSDSPALYRPTLAQAGPFPVYKDDVNMAKELYNLSISGTLFGKVYGGDPPAESAIVAPLMMAQSLQIRGGGGHGAAPKGLEKPATSQFAMPSTSLSSPFALGLAVAPKRDALATRLGGPAFGGIGGTTTRAVDTAGLRLASLSDADAEEGGTAVGTKHLKGVERTESKGIDSNVAHAGPGAVTAQTGGNNDDEDHQGVDPDPTVTASATSPVAGAAPAGRRVPQASKAEQPPAVATAEVGEQNTNANLGAPPRRRAPQAQDAISA